MTMPATEPPFSQSPASIRMRGGAGAPGRARLYVMAQLDGQIPDNAACDAALIVSELVTNSVLHANVGVHDALSLELTPLDDRINLPWPLGALFPQAYSVGDLISVTGLFVVAFVATRRRATPTDLGQAL